MVDSSGTFQVSRKHRIQVCEAKWRRLSVLIPLLQVLGFWENLPPYNTRYYKLVVLAGVFDGMST